MADKDTKERRIDTLEMQIKDDKDRTQDERISDLELWKADIDEARKRLPWMLLAAVVSVIASGATMLVVETLGRAVLVGRVESVEAMHESIAAHRLGSTR